MRGGWWQIAAWHGAPIRLHWSVLIGALAFSGFRLAPGSWFSYVLLICIHEMGHAVLVHRYRLGVLEIAVHGLGGHCRHESAGNPWQSAVIASDR
ncbi:MAG: hypothetical protein SFV15_12520 [Polyangiaceae bacterium]|nr:hypothetical protein [Polyangiaceae bacterium]